MPRLGEFQVPPSPLHILMPPNPHSPPPFLSYFVFPIQIRRQRQANSSARYVRYPSPASETHNREENEVDFKTAYRDSVYQIRYPDDLMVPEFDSIVMGDPFGITPVQR